VVDVEGLHSPKAIAFINSKGNIRLEAKTYSEVRMFPQVEAAISSRRAQLNLGTSLDNVVIETGEGKWKK